MSMFYSCSHISGACGNLIAAGILSGLAGVRRMAAWQWLSIVAGSTTVCTGLVIMVILPDFLDTWRLLLPELKHVAPRKLAIDAAEADNDEPGAISQFHGFKLAMTDVKTYILAVAYMCITSASGFRNFFPTPTETLGYNKIDSLFTRRPTIHIDGLL
jgi:MFS family permease